MYKIFGYPSFYGKFAESHNPKYGRVAMFYGMFYSRRKPLKVMLVHYNAVFEPPVVEPWKETLTWRFAKWDDMYSFYGQFNEHLFDTDLSDVVNYQNMVYRRKSRKTWTKVWGVTSLKRLGHRVVDIQSWTISSSSS